MKRILLSVLLMAVAAQFAQSQVVSQEHKDRAAALVSKMTLQEKIDYLGGEDKFYIRAVERLGIPKIRMADGPQGVRNNTRSTLYPCGVAAAASWNPEAVRDMGRGIGQDARARGVHIMLGPGVNIYRSPLCGRNFEYFGEDPFLAAETTVAYIEGIQSQGVMATVKHFAMNNQEYDRHHVSSDADERTMNEIYLPAFRAAVERARVGALMTSYNLVNNVHAPENTYLIRDRLRGRWGFEGIVMSDWTSTYSTLGCVAGGLDLEMPKSYYMDYESVRKLLDNGVVTIEQIDEKVQHILQTLIAFGFLDRPQLDKRISEDNPFSREAAYRLACESAVLLKNNGILPLKPIKKKEIVVLGRHIEKTPCGGGSGRVDPLYSVSLYEGMKELGSAYPVRLVSADAQGSYFNAESLKAIREAAAVVLCTGFDIKTESESFDKKGFSLPAGQNELISTVTALNPNTVVVVYSGSSFDVTPWYNQAAALVQGFYPGQEGGRAIAQMLAGKVNPSGKLPYTFEKDWKDNPCYAHYKPEPLRTHRDKKGRYKYQSTPRVTYGEGIFVGYRGYEHFGIEPFFPFGFGLSYTSFDYSDLSVRKEGSETLVRFTLRNSGKLDGAEVAEVYVGAREPKVVRPAKELKGFTKVFLKKGESRTVEVRLSADAFARFDINRHDWVSDPGAYDIYVGASSRDIRLKGEVNL